MSQDGGGRSDRSREFLDKDGRTLPERIRHRRLSRGLRSYALARALDVSPSYVTMIERGKKVPSEDIAVAIATILGDDPELYRAWVHSTRFTAPRSTLRGLQQLSYSGPTSTNRPAASARFESASRRARRKREDPAQRDVTADRLRTLERRLTSRLPQTALIALGTVTEDQVTFWRLPWALLDNDPRPRRYVVSRSYDPEKLLVATPEEFADIVMSDAESDLMQTDTWRGWEDPPAAGAHGGSHTQPLLTQQKFGPLLRDKARFLDSIGAFADVIVRQGQSVSIQRLTLSEFVSLLQNPL